MAPQNCMTESVERETIEQVASLARVAISDEDAEILAADFAEILEYFETLEEVPTVDSDEELVNVMRADEIEESLDQEAAIRNAPETEDGYVKGPPVG